MRQCNDLCLADSRCKAIDFYRVTAWCNLYDRACNNPLLDKDQASSYLLRRGCPQAGSGDGMMGILGNPTKYVCNAVQTVLAHLSNASNVTFQATQVAKSDRRFWQQQPRRKMSLTERSSVRKDVNASVRQNNATDTPRQESPFKRGDAEISHTNARRKRRALSRFTRDQNVSAETPTQESARRRVPSVKRYTIPSHPRPGKRCASAKHDLGDDLLTVVAVVPIGPWAFSQRQYLRKYLSTPAHAVRSRQLYRKIYSSSSPKRQPSFSVYMDRDHKLGGLKAYKHINYTSHKWGWNLVNMAAPVDDPRAVCVEIIFAVS